MKKIRLLRNAHCYDFPYDIMRIVRAMADCGFECSELEAQTMWSKYSDDLCSGWINVPDDSELVVRAIRSQFEPIDD